MAIQITRAEYERKFRTPPPIQKAAASVPLASKARAQEPPKSFLARAAGTTDVLFGGGKIGEAIGTTVAKMGLTGLTQEQRKYVSPGPSAKEVAGSALQAAALFTPVGKIAKGVTTAARALGLRKGVSAVGKIGAGATAGAAFDIASSLQGEQPTGLGTALGVGIPTVGVGLNIAGRVSSKIAPKLLSYTSDVPEKAFEMLLQRRQPVTQVMKAGITHEQALSQTQKAVHQLRSTLTKEWDEATQSIYNEFSSQRWGMGDQAVKLARKISDDFGIALPSNLKSFSAKESLDLLKEINELYSKRVVRESVQGIGVRKFKAFLQKAVIKNFGGTQGSVANLFKNYTTKKGILDAANDITRAYSIGKPIQQATALGRLRALFNENKSAYLNAILDLEKATGRDLLSGITAAQFREKLPKTLASVSASGGLQSPRGLIDKALSLLIIPLSSPRSAAFIARTLSRIKSPGLPRGTSPGDYLLGETSGKSTRKGQNAIRLLSARKSGEIKNAFSNSEIGNIDLKWGTIAGEGGGLSKIIQEHPEVVNQLDNILKNAKIVGGREGRIYMETPDGFRVIIRTDFDGKPQQWLLTAYKKEIGQGGRNRTSDESFQTTHDTISPRPAKTNISNFPKKVK